MKQTGVFRRIDELGRIVIPKEIRKSLKIKDGEPLEIFTDDDMIILKKYSFMSDLAAIAQNCSDSFYDVIEKNIIITDTDKIIAVSGSLRKKYYNKEISKKLNDLINNRQTIINVVDEIEISPDIIEESKYVISPVMSYGDAVGSVIILSDEAIGDFEKKSAKFISKFLSKHLD